MSSQLPWIPAFAGMTFMLAIVKKELQLELSLYTILQILSLSLFERMPILQAFAEG